MKKSSLLLVLFLISASFQTWSQGELKSTRIIAGNTVEFDADLEWAYHLQEYEKEISNDVSRFSFLNEQAYKRAYYFSKVLSYNSKDKKLIETLREVNHGPEAHDRAFGDENKFDEPADVIYCPLYQNLKGRGSIERSIENEIYQGCYYSLRTQEEMDDYRLVMRAINAHRKKEGDDFILKNYLDSKSHKEGIEDSDNDSFGTCTMYIVHKWVEADGRWRNEVLLFNLTVFGEEI